MRSQEGRGHGVAVSLAAVAGAVNGCGICALGIYTATMTPAATTVGTSLARGELWLAFQAFLLIACRPGDSTRVHPAIG